MNTLRRIIDLKKSEIPGKLPSGDIVKTQKDVLKALKKNSAKLKLIAEIKRQSPSQGRINSEMTVASAIELYHPFASAISVLTEKNFFGGSLNDLREASAITELPLLRKDFITHPIQVSEARLYGADFYLLIAAALEKNQMVELLDAGREYNMPALVEVHTEKELETVLDLEVKLLGINNRNLTDLTIDIGTTEILSAKIPARIRENIIVISESGLKNSHDLARVGKSVDGVLIGTAFMESKYPERLLQSMFGS